MNRRRWVHSDESASSRESSDFMTLLRCLSLLFTTGLMAQSPEYFPEEATEWWRPQWEVRLRAERISTVSSEADGLDLRREGAQLRLRWEGGWDHLQIRLGTRSAFGSDGNVFNIWRYDQLPSNGTRLDLARIDLMAASEKAFGEFRVGFQENPLISSESLWDPDLRFLGASARAGLRAPLGLVQEAGLRFAAGRVRTLQGGDVDLAAGQAVLKLDTGPLSWTAHGGRWVLRWRAGYGRLHAIPGREARDLQRLALDAYGLAVSWNAILPVEVRTISHRNSDTHEHGSQFQVLAGSIERPFRPRFSYTWQTLSRADSLYPVNGDQWWFFRNARGGRYEVALPLPRQWLFSAVFLRQQTYGGEYPVARRMVTLTKRF